MEEVDSLVEGIRVAVEEIGGKVRLWGTHSTGA